MKMPKQLRVSNLAVQGIALPEVLFTFLMVGILSAIAVPSIQFGLRPTPDASHGVANLLKLSRSKAMAQTSAYRLRAVSPTQFRIEQATTCANDAQWRRDPGFTDAELALPQGVELVGVSVNGNALPPVDPKQPWAVCFNSRGLAFQHIQLSLGGSDRQQQVQVLLGGAVRLGAN
ncbi:hypothetical protein GS597_01890 [Synechococcales cyanobacterium C]|uniref:Uncharacterized protein n=1 Tax=Petrachloros mirabilis ULC683 TaxID=2781853 RepID=A0A8K2ABW0_9CYAN|nr:hypothetical protein [Petrachloros mirabilis]NCJ05286.1 hypothetical protein [Petrachloros mirabilis ULC683]